VNSSPLEVDMDIDWTQIRGALSRIEEELSRAKKVIDSTDEDLVRDWPEVRRQDLEAAFPNWREEYGPNWVHDFLEKRIGRENFRIRKGSRKYRISPEAYRALNLGIKVQAPESTKPS
jgi:hypothetical protein